MRSRYSAYVVLDADYLLHSWSNLSRPAEVQLDSSQRWLGLKVLNTEAGGPDDHKGTVEFVARFKVAGKAHRMHEVSRFVRESGRWVYLDGDIVE